MKTNKEKLEIQRRAIEKKIQPWLKLRAHKIPIKGWLRAIRESLGLNARQLAKRCKVHNSTILEIEKREIIGTVHIKTLEKIAKAMNCKLVYALVPKDGYNRLENIIDERAKFIAERIVRKTAQTMLLEDQVISPMDMKKHVLQLADKLKRDMSPLLWKESLDQ